MPIYALSFLLPNLTLENKNRILEEIEARIKKLQGKIEDKFFERKRFVYPVKKNQTGIFGEIVFSLEAEGLLQFGEFLKFHPQILRTIIERKKETVPLISKREPLSFTRKKKGKVKIEELDKKLEELLK